MASAYPELERAARDVYKRTCEVFAELEIGLVNFHPTLRGLRGKSAIERNADAVADVAARAAELGQRIMVENMGGGFGTPEELGPLLDAAENVAFHLDIAHANVRPYGQPNRLPALLDAFAERIAHVHLHDNKGRYDDHLPVGVGSLDFREAARLLHATGWDGTLTLELFAKPPVYTYASRDLWLEAWAAASVDEESRNRRTSGTDT
jgi:sugar phosphate isomerase/epimerase